MKRLTDTFCKAVLGITVMSFTALFGFCGCARGSKRNVNTVEEMTLTQRGMRGGTVYKIENKDGRVELRRYREIYSGEETALEPEGSAVCEAEAFVELMNSCGVMQWNGFHGKHPKNVSDGITFSLTATVNGGESITADGSARYPKGYLDFVRALGGMLASGENN
ncbi:MAG: hypothetical protein IJP16_06570 [Clostridia bacterium]|nr:hypothetical protein [Clostridia bacterium]